MNLMALSLIHTHNAESWHSLKNRYNMSGARRPLKAFFYDKVMKRFGEVTFDPHYPFDTNNNFARILTCYEPRLVSTNLRTWSEECEPF